MKIREHAVIMRRSYRYLYQLDAVYTIYLVITAILTAVIPYISIYMSAFIIDELAGQHRIEQLFLYTVVTVGLTFILHMINIFLGKIRDYHQELVYKNESRAWAEKTATLDYADIENTEIYSLREKIRLESQMGYNLYYLYTGLNQCIQSVSQIVVSIALSIGLFTNSAMTVTVRLFFLTSIVLVTVGNYFTARRSMQEEETMYSEGLWVNSIGNYIWDHFGEYHSGTEVRMYGMEKLVSDRFRQYDEEWYSMMYRAKRRQLGCDLWSQFLVYGLEIIVYAVVIFAALRGGISVGSIAKYVSSIYMLTVAFQELVRMGTIMLKNNEYLKTYFSFLDIPSRMYQGSLPVEKRAFCDDGDTEYEIEFRNVSFRYPGASTYALRNVSLKFKVGEKLAVVGMNGSGKTTFIKLLCRLYDPTEGEILLNGIDIRKYDYDEYLSVFSVVFQDYQLFAFSLGQNVASTVSYKEDIVRDCLERAGFGNRLVNMPHGLETCLYKDFDENGVEISGGEAQKIALARALYKDAPFIVLDEPTAALDPIAEAEIYSRFNKIAGNKTTIYISHRLSSCRFCDNIAVFHNGELVQRGRHEELVEMDGKYAELWKAQAQWYV